MQYIAEFGLIFVVVIIVLVVFGWPMEKLIQRDIQMKKHFYCRTDDSTIQLMYTDDAGNDYVIDNGESTSTENSFWKDSNPNPPTFRKV